jgi:hypothetical protein
LSQTLLGHQQPDEIRQLLEGAKQQTSNKSSIPMNNVMVVPPEDDGYDASIENAIREDLLTHGKSSGNMQLQQFINAHSGNMHIS